MKLSTTFVISILLFSTYFDKVCSLDKFDALKAYERFENHSVSWECPCGQYNDFEDSRNYLDTECSKCGRARFISDLGDEIDDTDDNESKDDTKENYALIQSTQEFDENECHFCGGYYTFGNKNRARGKMCEGCQRVRYCSNHCQKMDWNFFNHRETCGNPGYTIVLEMDPPTENIYWFANYIPLDYPAPDRTQPDALLEWKKKWMLSSNYDASDDNKWLPNSMNVRPGRYRICLFLSTKPISLIPTDNSVNFIAAGELPVVDVPKDLQELRGSIGKVKITMTYDKKYISDTLERYRRENMGSFAFYNIR